MLRLARLEAVQFRNRLPGFPLPKALPLASRLRQAQGAAPMLRRGVTCEDAAKGVFKW